MEQLVTIKSAQINKNRFIHFLHNAYLSLWYHVAMNFAMRLAAIIIVVFGITVFSDFQSNRVAQEKFIASQEAATPKLASSAVRIGDIMFSVEIADTENARTRGLSYRESLSPNNGMLFVFEKPGHYTFWMPNMNFPLDIIWIDENKKIVGFAENAKPTTEKEPAIIYAPPKPILYAIEVNAGFIKANNITTGQKAEIF